MAQIVYNPTTLFVNKFSNIVVATFVIVATKNFDNIVVLAIILCQRCLLSKNSCENISDLQMAITHARIIQTEQLRCFLTSIYFENV